MIDGQVPSSAPRLSGTGSSAPDFKEQPAPDVVFIVQEHVRRPELQYALRSWSLVPHGKVWLIGGCPNWVTNVNHVPFPDGDDKWRNISDKFRSLADLEELSDWFYYTEDDYHIIKPQPEGIPLYRHETPLRPRVAEYLARRKREPRGGWEGYLTATLRVLEKVGISDPDSFDVHIPMLVDKSRIPTHLDTPLPVSWRSLYGNLCGYPSVHVDVDVKTGNQGTLAQKAATGFLSSSEGTFRRSGIEALLADKFPSRSIYEREDDGMADMKPVEGRQQWRKDRLVRRVTRDGATLVRTENGWVDEVSGDGAASSSVVPSPDNSPEDLYCLQCDRTFKSVAGLMGHNRAKHPKVD